jgi:hypothetical protein
VRCISVECVAMQLSPKAVRFLVDAVEYRITAYQAQLASQDLDEDTTADLSNDLLFLEALLADLRVAQESTPARVF